MYSRFLSHLHTTILVKIVELYDARKITSFGHVKFYFYFTKGKSGVRGPYGQFDTVYELDC